MIEHHDGDTALAEDLIALMNAQRLDLISTMRSFSDHLRGQSLDLGEWTTRWEARLALEGRDAGVVADEIDTVNPFVIPRNIAVDDALTAATNGDMAPFTRLLDALRTPYRSRDDVSDLAEPGPHRPGFRTFCGT